MMLIEWISWLLHSFVDFVLVVRERRQRYEQARQKAIEDELEEACRSRPQSLDKIRRLLKEHPDAVKIKEALPLHLACCYNAPLEVIQFLVEQWPESVKVKDRNGMFPIHKVFHVPFLATKGSWSTYSRRILDTKVAMVRYLVNQWPESVMIEDNAGLTPLHYALYRFKSTKMTRYSEFVVDTLIQNSPQTVMIKNNEGMLPLHIACANGASLQVLQYLIQKWPKSVWEKTNDRRLALHLACESSANLVVIQYLVGTWPESVRENDKDGNLPLQVACTNNAPLEVIYYLVQQWPESVRYLVP